jgi:prepilin-type N-terminal cleavage/methylation domain-containing protein
MSRLKSTKGFTLIELVIVLAIAALIIAGVLIAVGGAQRTQRDQSRKNISGRVSSAIANYASNNNGVYAGFTCVAATYCQGIVDPDTNLAPTGGAAAATATNVSGIRWSVPAVGSGTGFICAAGATVAGGTARSYAISYWSESAAAAQCISNQ